MLAERISARDARSGSARYLSNARRSGKLTTWTSRTGLSGSLGSSTNVRSIAPPWRAITTDAFVSYSRNIFKEPMWGVKIATIKSRLCPLVWPIEIELYPHSVAKLGYNWLRKRFLPVPKSEDDLVFPSIRGRPQTTIFRRKHHGLGHIVCRRTFRSRLGHRS